MQFALVTACLATGVFAESHVEVSEAWIRLPPPGARTAAGYARITNMGDASIELVAAESPEFGYAMFHKSLIQDGVARMRHLKTVEIAEGDTWVFEPGGAHLMLFDPVRTLKPGDDVEIRFETASGEWLTTVFDVRRGHQ